MTTVHSMSLALPRLHTLCVLSIAFVNSVSVVAATQITLFPTTKTNKMIIHMYKHEKLRLAAVAGTPKKCNYKHIHIQYNFNIYYENYVL